MVVLRTQGCVVVVLRNQGSGVVVLRVVVVVVAWNLEAESPPILTRTPNRRSTIDCGVGRGDREGWDGRDGADVAGVGTQLGGWSWAWKALQLRSR